jgi:peptidoglycan/LPS O-acetylase OafA/YrhL
VRDKVRLVESRWLWIYVPAAACLMGICLMVRNEAFRETLRYTLQGIALTVLFIAAIRFPLWRGMQLLNLKPVIYIGLISYSLYLLHFAVIFGVERALPMMNVFGQAFLALAISCGLSSAIYFVIEKPFARLRHNLK